MVEIYENSRSLRDTYVVINVDRGVDHRKTSPYAINTHSSRNPAVLCILATIEMP